MSAFVPDSHRSSVRVGGADLEFSHVSLFCFTLSNVAMAAYCGGAIDAQAELVVEMALLEQHGGEGDERGHALAHRGGAEQRGDLQVQARYDVMHTHVSVPVYEHVYVIV